MMKRSPDECEPTNKCQNNCDSNPNESQTDLVYVNIYIPELQSEQTVICSKYESIWNLKRGLIERCNNGLKSTDLNYGFFCTSFGHFLDEELNLNNYFAEVIQKCCNRIRLELLYKQRIKVGEVMSTLPAASTTRRRRKRSRLMTAVTNGNIEKVAKILVNCDPNFVDETSGETPLSLAATSQSTTTSAVQRIIVALVNGGALLDFRTKDGRTALHCAVQKSNYVALKTLMDLGASPNYVDASGLTSLCYTILNQSNPKLTQLLLHEHSVIGVSDQHGWQEVHHACKLGLVAHLEQLLYYGCDMNCRIVGSGNTPLHVSAINDQLDCARVLLLRGCDTNVVNNSHQNAYQVAVIAGNMSLAELISNHKPEMVVPYRDKPKYNPARRAPHGQDEQHLNRLETAQYRAQNGTQSAIQAQHQKQCPSSPSLSQRSCATSTTTTTTSSGVCCEDGSQSDGADEEEDESEDESSVRPVQLLPGMTVVAVADYNSGDPTHLALRRNDIILLLQNQSSPPTIANQKLLLGRRCVDAKEGLFPTCCVEKVKLRVEGRRDQKYSATTLPARGRSHTKNFLKSQDSHSSGGSASGLGLYHERTVTLQRGSKGFGFVLRGAKATSPMMKSEPKQSLIGLQYLDEIESQAVAEAAGLKRGDFLLAVNGSDVRHMSHEMVVQLIRQSGDRVTMTVATPIPQHKKPGLVSILKKDSDSKTLKSKSSHSSQHKTTDLSDDCSDPNALSTSLPSGRSTHGSNLMQKFSTLPRNSPNSSSSSSQSRSTSRGRAPPAPPKRDPNTTLSIGRARARSLLLPNTSGQSGTQSSNRSELTSGADYDSEGRSTKSSSPTTSIESMIVNNRRNNNGSNSESSKVASIRSRSTRRISSYELQEFFSRQTETNPQFKTFESLTALKKKKKNQSNLHKNFNSTPDIQKQLSEQLTKSRFNQMSNSEEELYYSTGVYAETLPLRGGKFIPNQELSTNFDSKTTAPARAPPPTYPPPPPPPTGLQTSVIKLTLAKHSQSDYANYESVTQNQQMLSSFRPVVNTIDEPVTTKATEKIITIVPKAPAPPPGSQPSVATGTLRAVRQPNTSSTTTSVYTRQDTIEKLESHTCPNIPEPDYSTDSDEEIKTNRDLSTFKANVTETNAKSAVNTSAAETASEVLSNRLTQSFAETLPKTTTSSTSKPQSNATFDRKAQMVCPEELRAQTQKIMSKSMSNNVESNVKNVKNVENNNSKTDSISDKSSESSAVSKVRKNIREFERRSSICGETTVPAVPAVQPLMSVSTKKEPNISNNNNSNSLRMSKSCFEVDCCDNSSSGVSSDVDGEYGVKSDVKSGQTSQQMHCLNRRNSQIVSEKIANLMAVTHQNSQTSTPAPVAPKPSTTSGISNAQSTGSTGGLGVVPEPQMQPYLTQTRRTASVSEDNHKTRVKCWQTSSQSVIGSLPSTVPSTVPSNQISTNLVPNIQQLNSTQKSVKFSINQLKSEPKTTNASDIPNTSGQTAGNVPKTGAKPVANAGAPIRLHIDGLGLAAVNEVDVLAELVPPPPEFAAPPPGHPCRTGALGTATAEHYNRAQQLSQCQLQSRQQQLQQLRQQQILQQQRRLRQQSPGPSAQPPPIPSQPPPPTLPHQHQIHQHLIANKEEIRILSPTPHQTMAGHHNPQHHSHPLPQQQQQQLQQHYQRIHQKAMEARAGQAQSGQPGGPPPPPEFSDLLSRQRAAQRAHQQQIEQQISASMRLGVNDWQLTQHSNQLQGQNTAHSALAQTQQFATLQRQHNSSGGQSLQSYGGQQSTLQSQSAQQFATLTRHQMASQQSAAKQSANSQSSQRHNYCDYTRLTVQNRLMRHMCASPQPTQHTQHTQHTQQPPHNPQQPQPLPFVRKAVIEWTPEDVNQWLKMIGMSEHQSKFECFNGPKLIRLDNNALLAQGIRQQQHRIYLLDKLKQQLCKSHH